MAWRQSWTRPADKRLSAAAVHEIYDDLLRWNLRGPNTAALVNERWAGIGVWL